jgi:hypothetical protein
MSKRTKTKSLTQTVGTRWAPGEVRMWTAENKRANDSKQAARGRTYKGEYT